MRHCYDIVDKKFIKTYVDIHDGDCSPAASLAEDDASELVVDEDAAEVESEDAADADDVQPLNLTTKRSDLMGGSGKRLHIHTSLFPN